MPGIELSFLPSPYVGTRQATAAQAADVSANVSDTSLAKFDAEAAATAQWIDARVTQAKDALRTSEKCALGVNKIPAQKEGALASIGKNRFVGTTFGLPKLNILHGSRSTAINKNTLYEAAKAAEKIFGSLRREDSQGSKLPDWILDGPVSLLLCIIGKLGIQGNASTVTELNVEIQHQSLTQQNAATKSAADYRSQVESYLAEKAKAAKMGILGDFIKFFIKDIPKLVGAAILTAQAFATDNPVALAAAGSMFEAFLAASVSDCLSALQHGAAMMGIVGVDFSKEISQLDQVDEILTYVGFALGLIGIGVEMAGAREALNEVADALVPDFTGILESEAADLETTLGKIEEKIPSAVESLFSKLEAQAFGSTSRFEAEAFEESLGATLKEFAETSGSDFSNAAESSVKEAAKKVLAERITYSLKSTFLDQLLAGSTSAVIAQAVSSCGTAGIAINTSIWSTKMAKDQRDYDTDSADIQQQKQIISIAKQRSDNEVQRTGDTMKTMSSIIQAISALIQEYGQSMSKLAQAA